MFRALVYTPLYNGLVFLMDLLPWADVGVVVVVFTVVVRLVLFPLAQRAVKTQMAMRALEPELKRVKEKHTDNKQKQAEETMRLYRENKVNPFSSFLVLLIQLPIIFGLYFIFLRGGLPNIDTDLLYSFVSTPESVTMMFLGLVDLSKKSLILAVLTGVTQFVQGRLAVPMTPPRAKNASLKDDITRSMQLQIKYVMPVFIAIIAYTLPSVIALYWTTTNLFTIGQELFVRRTLKRSTSAP
ncbi:YidC/Oxa1 family membrane protein insertase [Candidatus Wolfebacteria bacterium]|nr:YidC/Oxa1 family membrane protein insertase [Candidatus Wolfebacteria bacterium]